MLKLVVSLSFFRRDDKPGGWGDFLCVRSDARSHERSSRLHQWDLQGWCESASPPVVVQIMTCICAVFAWTNVFLFFVAARTAAGVWCHLHCHHHRDKVTIRLRCLLENSTAPSLKLLSGWILFMFSIIKPLDLENFWWIFLLCF